MNRSISLHPASLALGLVLAGVAFLAMGQATVPTPLRVEYVPHPRDMVQIQEGTPFTVPAGRIFVLTALGRASQACGSATQVLRVNGQVEVTSYFVPANGAVGSNIQQMATGFAVPPGSVVEVDDAAGGFDCARAWGYLVNQ